jgi:hypothetical protein
MKFVLVLNENINGYCVCYTNGDVYCKENVLLSSKTVLKCSVMGELWQMATDVMICTDMW